MKCLASPPKNCQYRVLNTQAPRALQQRVSRRCQIKLANVLKQAMAADKPVELQSLDIICKVAFGVELGGISPDLPEVPFAKAFDAAQRLLAQRIVTPLFQLQRALDATLERRFRKAVEEEREDLLSSYKELRDVTIGFSLAGRDTNGSTLAWLIYETCCNPEIADKIYKEEIEVAGKKLLLSPWRSI